MKQKKPKQARAGGCKRRKPSKNSYQRTADRMKDRRIWQRLEER